MNFSPVLPNTTFHSGMNVFFVGIKGVGMTALALMLKQAGVDVSGVDGAEEYVTDKALHEADIRIDTWDDLQLPENIDVVVYSGANQGSKNPLVKSGVERGIPTLNLAQAVGILSRMQSNVAVCGVGGKSTTSALLSWMFVFAEIPVSFAVGVGDIPNLGRSGQWENDGLHFIVEADEYVSDPLADITPRFLYLNPEIVICTSLQFDHPDVYKNFEDTKEAFRTFFQKIPAHGLLVYNADESELVKLIESANLKCKTVAVGENTTAEYILREWKVENGLGSVLLNDHLLVSQVPGQHNLRNAAYAAVVAEHVGISWEKISGAIREFLSTQRRFEYRGKTVSGTMCFDDYAHHPRELRALAHTLQTWFSDKKTTLIFQPHTFSRTRALRKDFSESLAGSADSVVLMPIFASAREAYDDSISSRDLVSDLQNAGQSVLYAENPEEVLQLVKQLGPDDVCITVGAGDVYKVYDYVELRKTS